MAIVRFAVVLAVLGAAAAVALVVRGPVNGLDVLIAVTAVVYLPVVLVGSAIVRVNRRNRVGWLFLLSGFAMPVSVAAQVAAVVLAARFGTGSGAAVALYIMGNALFVLGVPPLATIGVLVFPDGQLGSRRRRILAVAFGADLVLLLVWAVLGPEQDPRVMATNPLSPGGTLAGIIDLLVLCILVMGPMIALAAWALFRRARTEPPGRAEALRLAAATALVVCVAYLCCVVAGFTTGQTAPVAVLENVAAMTLGLAAWVGIVRYGLFDTRTVMNRALVYGSLTVLVVAVYLGSTVVLGLFVGGLVPQVIATALAALAVLPLRDAAQRRANTFLYGLRDEPATALTRLGERLNAAADPKDLLPAAARTVAEALRLPYVAIEVAGGSLAAHGRLALGPTEQVPLPFAGETIGFLVLQRREPEDRAERALLDNLARQVAVAARAVVATQDLQQSRERLVGLREEERRRLRHDLHDGLGPTLAGIALGIDTVRRSLPADAAACALLASLRQESENAVSDIRRIVYDLRPAILDELGLAGAVREQASRLGGARVTVPDELPTLPAAVEVAAYRITVEALTNASRHAAGSPVSVELSANGQLELTVSDDGDGIAMGFVAGVGITSMRERAAELGGLCTVERRGERGTVVRARLPLDHP